MQALASAGLGTNVSTRSGEDGGVLAPAAQLNRDATPTSPDDSSDSSSSDDEANQGNHRKEATGKLCVRTPGCPKPAGHLGRCPQPKALDADSPRKAKAPAVVVEGGQCLRDPACVNPAGHRGRCKLRPVYPDEGEGDQGKGDDEGNVITIDMEGETSDDEDEEGEQQQEEEEGGGVDDGPPAECQRNLSCVKPAGHKGWCRTKHASETTSPIKSPAGGSAAAAVGSGGSGDKAGQKVAAAPAAQKLPATKSLRSRPDPDLPGPSFKLRKTSQRPPRQHQPLPLSPGPQLMALTNAAMAMAQFDPRSPSQGPFVASTPLPAARRALDTVLTQCGLLPDERLCFLMAFVQMPGDARDALLEAFQEYKAQGNKAAVARAVRFKLQLGGK